MDVTRDSGPGELGWTEVAACTLPTAERPLRLAEFDDLFSSAVRSIERSGDTHARLLLAGDDTLPARTQRLADAESSCCSFFAFDVSTLQGGLVALDITVPDEESEVLVALVARAQTAQGATS